MICQILCGQEFMTVSIYVLKVHVSFMKNWGQTTQRIYKPDGYTFFYIRKWFNKKVGLETPNGEDPG